MWAAMTRSLEMFVALIELYSTGAQQAASEAAAAARQAAGLGGSGGAQATTTNDGDGGDGAVGYDRQSRYESVCVCVEDMLWGGWARKVGGRWWEGRVCNMCAIHVHH